jgi:GxxExxY protein
LIFTAEDAEEHGGMWLIFTAEDAEEHGGMTSRAKINELTGKLVDAAMKVHTVLGPGLLESAYEACLAYKLEQRGLKVHSQVEVPVLYENIRIDVGYRCDLVVEDTVISVDQSRVTVLSDHQAASYFRQRSYGFASPPVCYPGPGGY